MILGFIFGLSILFLVLITLFILKLAKSKVELKSDMIAVLFFVASIIISANIFACAIYVDDGGTVINKFDLNQTFVEVHSDNGFLDYVIVTYNKNGITLSEKYDRVFGNYLNSTNIEIRQDALGMKTVFN